MPKDKDLFRPKLFKQFEVKDIAEAITFVMFRIYANIGPSEMHDG